VHASRLKTLFVVLLLGIGWKVQCRNQRERATQPVPAEVAAIERGPMELRRTFTGTLEARVEFVAAPKVSGRVSHGPFCYWWGEYGSIGGLAGGDLDAPPHSWQPTLDPYEVLSQSFLGSPCSLG
jgi:hypothetical protein